MNGDLGDKRLPELEDEDVAILDAICKRAAQYDIPPNNAIFTSYSHILAEYGIDEKQDPVLFPWMCRLSSVKDARSTRKPNFVGRLRALLEEHGITVVDDNDTVEGQQNARPRGDRRRVSFDDARYEETWLSNHTHTFDHKINVEDDLRESRNVRFSKHVRSISHGADRRQHQPRQESQGDNEQDAVVDLDEIAETFYRTTSWIRVRQYLQLWQQAVSSLANENLSREMIAAQHDRQMLQQQAWDTWRTTFMQREEGHQLARQEQQCEEILAAAPHLNLKRTVFDVWRAHLQDVRAIDQPAQEHVLRVRYFGRWKDFALETRARIERVLLQKYARRWLDAVQRNAERTVLASSAYNAHLARAALARWAARTIERRQQQRREDDLARQAIRKWRRTIVHAQRMFTRAQQFREQTILRSALVVMTTTLQQHCSQEINADRVHDQHLVVKATISLKRHATSLPLLQEARATKRQRTQHDVFTHWRQCTQENRKATEHNRCRLFRHALAAWNDALRVRTLEHRINERLKAQTLYRLMLEERSRTCTRMVKARLVNQCFQTLRTKVGDATAGEEQRLAHFDGEVHRQRLSQAVQRMHIVIRERDDAERAAVEFRNARLVPNIWQCLRDKSRHVQELNVWSRDAGFFVATKKTLRQWRTKTEQSKQSKRHHAYVQVRSNIKARLLRGAWNAMNEKMEAINNAQVTSYQRREEVDEASVHTALIALRRRSSTLKKMKDAAAKHDQSITARSAFNTMVATHDNITELDSLAVDLRADVDATTQAMVLKRLQFAAFTLTRLQENSTVYKARLSERHARQMLRHLAHTAKEKRMRTQEEPESPSIRPASRSTTRQPDLDVSGLQSSRRHTSGTPAYLKTPSRARRTKLRTIPTPAPFTPFTFTPKILASTPAPAHSMLDTTILEAEDSLAQITPFNRRLRASGINTDMRPTSILRRQPGTNLLATDKSVRFAGASRFQRSRND